MTNYSSKKTVSGRFDINTGKAYINDIEVSTDEYVAFHNMSKAEKLAKYGIEISGDGTNAEGDVSTEFIGVGGERNFGEGYKNLEAYYASDEYKIK